MTLPFWEPEGGQYGALYQDDNAWDTATIRGITVPGIVEVVGVPEKAMDMRKPAGKNGGTATIHGRKPAMFEIRVRMWTPEQWQHMVDLLGQIWPAGGATNTDALEIQHPALSFVGIDRGILIAPSTPQPGSAKGERVVSLRFMEFRPGDQKQGTKTVKQASVAPTVAPQYTNPSGTPLTAPDSLKAKLLPSADPDNLGP